MVTHQVVLDGLPLQVRSAGIAVYTEGLVRALAGLRPDDHFILYGIGGPSAYAIKRHVAPTEATESPTFPANVSWATSALYPVVMGYPIALPRLVPFQLRAWRPSLFHATNYAAPRTGKLPLVVTVHDLALLRFPELGTPALRRIVARTRDAVAAAARVICVSQATASDVHELLGIADDHIRVVYSGCDPAYRPLDPSLARRIVSDRFALEGPYVLHVGTLEPRKNLPRLLDAFAQVRRQTQAPHRLVLAGADGWGTRAIERAIAAFELSTVVRRLGPVPRDVLPALYNAADVLAYPSLYEGFGLPIVEAMACGTPVVTANVAALPEIAGNAALFVDPRDPPGIAAVLSRIINEESTRQILRTRGLAQARHFTWERCARETAAVYDEVLGRGP